MGKFGKNNYTLNGMIIYNKNGNKVLEVEVDDSSYRNRVIMGDHSLTLYYSLPEHIEIPVGSYCEFQGETFTLKRPNNFKMKHKRLFEYTVLFEPPEANAKVWKFRNPVDGRLKFPLTAKPHEHLQMFVDNMNRRDKGWTVGECVDGVETLIAYDHDFCIDALTRMASTFKTEYEFVGKRVSLRKIEYNKSVPLPLSYGRGNGFKPGVGRSNTGDNPPTEILFVQGGTDNIDPSKYGSSELLLPKNQTIAYDGEHFEDEDGFIPENARRYVVDEAGLSIRRYDKQLSSLAEDSLDCSEIYPKRIGTVSTVVVVDDKNNFYDIIDTTIPSSLNFEDCLIEGETMTVIFQSGMLAGREFEVKYYHNAVKGKAARRFEIVPADIDGQTMPNPTFSPKAGDKYAVFKCMLPTAYICDNTTKTGASWDMFRAAVKFLFESEDLRFTFKGELDGIWAKKDWVNIGGRIKLGGYILFSDNQFQKEGVLVRITGIKDYINKPHSPVIELSNTTVSGGVSSTLNDLKSEEVIVEDLHRDAIQFTKRRFRDAKDTISMLEEALLDNFTNSINPIAVQTMSLLVGDESLQFRFVNSKTNPVQVAHSIVYNNETKQLTAAAGIIQHMTIGINSVSSSHKASEYKYWNMTSYTSGRLDDGTKKYYLYAKVSKTAQTGVFILSETAIKLEGVSGFYHLLIGVLNSEYDGERSFVTLYGFTEVIPGRITTDKIVSSDGRSFFDMASNALHIGNGDSYLDWNNMSKDTLSTINMLLENATVKNKLSVMENADIAGWIFRNNRLESDNGNIFLDGKKGEVRLKGTIQHSTSQSGNFSDVDMFTLPAKTSSTFTISMGTEEEDIGKKCLLTNSSKIGSNGIYRVKCQRFGWMSGGTTKVNDYAEYYIIMPEETVEMSCFELPKGSVLLDNYAVERGGYWKITNRFNKEIPQLVAMGKVTNSTSGASIKGVSTAGADFSVTRNGTGNEQGTYTVKLPAFFEKANDLLISLTGIGTAQNGNSPIKATLISQAGRTFVVRTSDDASDNAGSFNFVVYSYGGYNIQ